MTTPDQPRCRNGACARMGTSGHPGLCDRCAGRLEVWLADLPGLWVRLHLRMPAGQATGERVSGTGEAPTPARVDVLSFVGPANPGDRLDLPGDAREKQLLAGLQVGDVPLLARLDVTVRVVCEQMTVTPPRQHAGDVFAFLGRWHRWLTAQPWADEYAQEVHDVWQRAKTLTGEWAPQPEPVVGVACPRCDAMALFRRPGEDGRDCDPAEGGCGRWLSDGEFDRWVRLSAHWAKEAG